MSLTLTPEPPPSFTNRVCSDSTPCSDSLPCGEGGLAPSTPTVLTATPKSVGTLTLTPR